MSRSFHDRLADLARPPESLKPDLSDMERRVGRRKGRKRLGSGATAAVIALAATVFLVRAFAQPTPQVPVGTLSPTVSNGKIAFARYSDGGWQIETINPDGTSEATLTNVPGNAFHPAWSPDGHRILFDVQSSGGRMQIFVVNDDGTGLTQLTDDPGWNYLPAWSSDGSKIAFVSTRDGNDEIYVMNADGSAQTRLTDSPVEDLSPSWAPGGGQIAFQSNRRGSNEIYVMNADGSDVTRLTDHPEAFDGRPEWSPDGDRIALASDRDGSGLYTMNTDGTDVVQLTHDPNVGSLDPAWSPDGASIVYTTSVDGSNRVGIFVVDVNTRSRQALLGAVGDVCCPTWQPISGVDQPVDDGETPLDDTSGPTPTPTLDTSPSLENGDALQIAGVPFLVCRVTVVSGDFGEGMDTAWVFEEERVPGAGCVQSEGFQRLAVGSDGRVDILSPRITDVLNDDAWKVWAYAAPDVNGDGIDEIAIAREGQQPRAIHLWLLTVAGGRIQTVSDATREPIDCGPDCDPAAWNVEIGPIIGKNGAVSDSGLSCGLLRPEDRDALVYWQADTENPLRVYLSKWHLDGRTLEPAGDGELFIDGTPGAYPPSGLDGLCGSPVSISPNYLTTT